MSATLTAEPETRPRKKEREIPVLEADRTLTRLADEFAPDPHEALAVITRHGKPALAVLSWEYFESLLETPEVMGNEEAMSAIRSSMRDVQEGKTRSWEDVKKDLGL